MPTTQSKPSHFWAGILFYRGRFEVPLAAAISHAHRSGHFLPMNRVDEAITEGREAIRLQKKSGLQDHENIKAVREIYELPRI